MAISVLGAQATEMVAAGTTLPVYKHLLSPLSVDDLLLVQADSAIAAPTVGTPAGYASYFSTTSGTALRQATFWKKALAADLTQTPSQPVPLVYSASATARAAFAAFRGVDTTDPANFVRSSVAGTSNAPGVGSLITPVPNCIVVLMVQTTQNADVTQPAGFTEMVDTAALPGTNTSRGSLSWKLFPAEGPTGAITASVATSQPWVATAIVLPPTDYPVFRSASTATNTTGPAVVCTKPTGAASFDSFTIGVKVDSLTTQVRTDPRFQLLSDTTSGAFRHLVYRHILAAVEPTGYEFRRSDSGYISVTISCYRNNLTSGEFTGARSSVATSSGTSHSSSLTTQRANSRLVFMLAQAGNNAGTTLITPPSGMTERLETQLQEGADVLQLTAGASGTKTAVSTVTATGVVSLVEILARYTEAAPAMDAPSFWGSPEMYMPPATPEMEPLNYWTAPEMYFAAGGAVEVPSQLMLMGVG